MSLLLRNLVALSLFGMLAVVGWGFKLLVDNQHAIQQSRVASCERTYHSFPLMFQPFFPSNPADWSEQQLRDWEKLGARADELAAGCSQQTKPKGG